MALDSNQARSADQLRWLDADLSRAALRRPRAIIVWMHDGPYSMGWHGDNGVLIRDYVPLFRKASRELWCSQATTTTSERGRRGQLNYIVTGGGGAELRPLQVWRPWRDAASIRRWPSSTSTTTSRSRCCRRPARLPQAHRRHRARAPARSCAAELNRQATTRRRARSGPVLVCRPCDGRRIQQVGDARFV